VVPRAFAALVALAVLIASQASAVGPLHPLPIECEPDDAWASDSYEDSDGHSIIADAFTACLTPDFWTGIAGGHQHGPVRLEDEVSITSDGTSVTASASATLDFPPDSFWARVSAGAGSKGRFRVPASAAGGRTGWSPATLRFEVARSGRPEDGHLAALVTGPGVDFGPRFHLLPDGVHEFETVLKPGETYELTLGASAALADPASYSGSVRFSVAAPEPARPLLILLGGAALALRARRLERT
jgi:hypothetical protein